PTLVMSGTSERSSTKDIAHLLRWTRADWSPVPKRPQDLEEWSLALDMNVGQTKRMSPGALLQLASAEDLAAGGSDMAVARRAFQRRLAETPGVIIVNESDCDQPLTVDFYMAPEDSAIDQAYLT